MDKKKFLAGIGLISGGVATLTAVGLQLDGVVVTALVGFMTLCLGIITGSTLEKPRQNN